MKTKVYDAEVVYLSPQSCATCADRARKSAAVCHDSFNCSLFDGAPEKSSQVIDAVMLGLEMPTVILDGEVWFEIEMLEV